MRSHGCGDLRHDASGQTVQLCGWVDRCRDHGGVIFVDLRDSSGSVQITVDPDNGAEMFAIAEHLRNETVIQVAGKVRERPADAINDRLATGRIEVLDDPTAGTSYAGPLLVLVDRFSASASEIFAGAIQDYRRGYVVGQRTFGKGTVQNLIPLDRWSQRPVDGQLTVTIGKFYRITGESTQHRGVEPDIILPSAISLDDVGESALEAALPWDRIAGVPFQAVRQPATVPTVAVLNREADLRNTKDADYRWMVADINAIESQRKLKSVSLNLLARKAERVQFDAARLERDNARRVAQGKAPLKALDDVDTDAVAAGTPAPTAGAVKGPDILLDQAAQIMADIIVATAPASASVTTPRKATP
jgi:carboxyl-terminal processing protease